MEDLQRDLWILVFATHPDLAVTLFHDQAETLADPATRQLFLDYDHAYDLAADDPLIDDLAHRIAEATRERYGPHELPGQDATSEIPALIQGTVNASSQAWQRLDTLIRAQLDA
ncbi:MerR family transcriptional regulator [Streptomyces sp. NBC_01244]|uniref:MerR family transcriptional regulator n=1 Tax=Streptomyces sp. NBC_01244 TaxID=2903797 RepID=UPI002E13E886|nr:MerR family transcriptional regulator [Streptomyces sp. NBC_01244]